MGIPTGIAVAAAVSVVPWEMLRPKEGPNPARQVRPNAYTQNGKSSLSIIRGSSGTDIETMVRNARYRL